MDEDNRNVKRDPYSEWPKVSGKVQTRKEKQMMAIQQQINAPPNIPLPFPEDGNGGNGYMLVDEVLVASATEEVSTDSATSSHGGTTRPSGSRNQQMVNPWNKSRHTQQESTNTVQSAKGKGKMQDTPPTTETKAKESINTVQSAEGKGEMQDTPPTTDTKAKQESINTVQSAKGKGKMQDTPPTTETKAKESTHTHQSATGEGEMQANRLEPLANTRLFPPTPRYPSPQQLVQRTTSPVPQWGVQYPQHYQCPLMMPYLQGQPYGLSGSVYDDLNLQPLYQIYGRELFSVYWNHATDLRAPSRPPGPRGRGINQGRPGTNREPIIRKPGNTRPPTPTPRKPKQSEATSICNTLPETPKSTPTAEPSTNTTSVLNRDWSPLDDGIEITLPADSGDNLVKRKRRLKVFSDICPDDDTDDDSPPESKQP